MITKTYQNNKFIQVKGDLFNYIQDRIKSGNNGASVIVPHVCNNIDLFGAGFAAAVAKHYPIVKENYHLLGKNFLRSNLGYVQYVKTLEDKNYGHKLIFANMIAQNGVLNKQNPRPLNYFALCKSMVGISKFIQSNFDQDNPVQIHAPKFGCGLAGGNWNFIESLIEDIWYNIPVYVYNPKQ